MTERAMTKFNRISGGAGDTERRYINNIQRFPSPEQDCDGDQYLYFPHSSGTRRRQKRGNRQGARSGRGTNKAADTLMTVTTREDDWRRDPSGSCKASAIPS